MTQDGGVFEMHAVPVGVLPVPGWEVFFGRNDTSMHELMFYVWLLADGKHKGLVDLGMPTRADDRAALVRACQAVDPRCVLRDVRSLPDLLTELRISPQAIDFACITQAVTYHTGGLLTELLPNAHVYLARAGVQEMLMDPSGHPPVDMFFTTDGWESIRTLAIEQRLHLVEFPVEVVSGVAFEPTGGHHPGSAALKITTTEGVVGILETAFLQGNVEESLPVGISENAAQCRAVIKRYRAECDEVLAIHDPQHVVRFGRL